MTLPGAVPARRVTQRESVRHPPGLFFVWPVNAVVASSRCLFCVRAVVSPGVHRCLKSRWDVSSLLAGCIDCSSQHESGSDQASILHQAWVPARVPAGRQHPAGGLARRMLAIPTGHSREAATAIEAITPSGFQMFGPANRRASPPARCFRRSATGKSTRCVRRFATGRSAGCYPRSATG